MNTITYSVSGELAEQVYHATQQSGFASTTAFITSVLKKYLVAEKKEEITFKVFKKRPLEDVEQELREAGKYNEKFIKSVIKGLSESSIYAHKTIGSQI